MTIKIGLVMLNDRKIKLAILISSKNVKSVENLYNFYN